MAQLGNGAGYVANPNELEADFGIVPAGEYFAIIEESDYKPSSTGQGMILKLTYVIIDGEFKGRKVFENLNLEHAKPNVEQIAKRTLNSICVALGLAGIKDSAQLHNQPMKIDVKVQPAKGEYEASNRISKHLSASASATTATPAPAGVPAGEPAPAGAVKKQPWDRS